MEHRRENQHALKQQQRVQIFLYLLTYLQYLPCPQGRVVSQQMNYVFAY